MRKLIVQTMVTLDGVMQAPGGPEEDPTGGFEHGGWTVPYFDEVLGQAAGESLAKPFDIVVGRRTYEIFAAHWPHDEGPIADRMNGAAKHVASRTLDRVDWQNSHLIEGDLAAAVAELKEQDGPELVVMGSATVAQALFAADLVDELRLWIFPLVLGRGRRLFAEGAVPASFELAESTVAPSGAVAAVYRKVGPPQTGSFAFDEPTGLEVERRAAMRASEE
jgi:dihydrofolate reductase